MKREDVRTADGASPPERLSAFSTTQGYIDLAGVEFPKEAAKLSERLWGEGVQADARYHLSRNTRH